MPTVESVLRESRDRIGRRKILTSELSKEKFQSGMEWLREVMFGRKLPGEAFHPLGGELAILERQIEKYIEAGRLIVGPDNVLGPQYEVLRRNFLCGGHSVSPEAFRNASDIVTRTLLMWAVARFGLRLPDAAILLPWRAGFAFAEAAFGGGFADEYFHFGARRNETTLATEVYFEEIPPSFKYYPEGRMVVIADPMLASGNTVIAAIDRLLRLRVLPWNIKVVCVISSPEGVDQVLHKFPKVQILAGRHDERLNEKGYIVPGLGDYGDLFFEGLDGRQVAMWRRLGILSDNAERALLARMAA